MLFSFEAEAKQGQKKIYGYEHKKIDKNGKLTYKKLQIGLEKYKLFSFIC